MKLVRNADKGARMWSNQAAALAALLAIQEALPIWEALVPEGVFAVLSAVAATGTIFLRLLDQNIGSDEGGGSQ